MSNSSYIVAAYGITWVVFVGYVTYLLARGRRAQQAAAESRPGARNG